MAELVIRDERIAWQLLDIARRENRSVEAVLDDLLADYRPETEQPKPGTFAALAEAARRANLRSEHPVDTSERSREILHSEYAEHLKRRMDEQPKDTD
jgi:hypothetical protein